MCTCIELKTKDFYFGRNLDLEYYFGEKVVITPRGYYFDLRAGEGFATKYAMIGMAATAPAAGKSAADSAKKDPAAGEKTAAAADYPLYAEAANEKGLCIAGLYFPGSAVYNEPAEGRLNLASFELIPWLLGNFASIEEAEASLRRLNVTNEAFSAKMPPAGLHWMISDGSRCIVLEQTAEGANLYENPFGVLTNNPPFPFHAVNMNNYLNLAVSNPAASGGLAPYGQGFGAIGLPGDWSPASRFVRAAFCKAHSVCAEDAESSVAQFFHILDAVAMVRGCVITPEGRCDVTTYSCCIDTARGAYYYKTYDRPDRKCVVMDEAAMTADRLTITELA